MPLLKVHHFIKSPSFSLTSITYCAQKLFQITTTWINSGFMARKQAAEVLQWRTLKAGDVKAVRQDQNWSNATANIHINGISGTVLSF